MAIEVILKKNEEKNLRCGYGWVFANEVYKTEGKDKNGSLCTVRSFDGRFIGKGYINYLSKILVRIFITNDQASDEEVIFERILRAKALRDEVFPTEPTYRAVFAEADLLPGLIVDKYGDALSVQFLTLGMDNKKEFIVECLKKIFSPKTIVERSDVAVREKEGLKQVKAYLYGEQKPFVEVEENGIKIKIDLLDGQKTGYFLDQKLNRLAIRKYVKGKTVLDCFSNAGGFALNAAIAGAKRVTALDISPVAVDEINRNAALNGFTNLCAVECDVFEKLREYKAQGEKFDVIVLDPPAFAKSSDSVVGALKGYKDINVLALKLINDGGIIVTSSCSHFISQQQFLNMLSQAAADAQKVVQVLEERTQSVDHPILLSAKETAYLKFIIARVGRF